MPYKWVLKRRIKAFLGGFEQGGEGFWFMGQEHMRSLTYEFCKRFWFGSGQFEISKEGGSITL
ncbi:hypothetical protein H5410_041203 [Solanum commersonii]|uniref:Uncharacterized protein n=1 Tax=Solanum commersonii TaxID=4109 RepID=A0A9J5XR56_SOLCO|nr:hypothetical protein H5410_041203 [Solanum commersonii]